MEIMNIGCLLSIIFTTTKTIRLHWLSSIESAFLHTSSISIHSIHAGKALFQQLRKLCQIMYSEKANEEEIDSFKYANGKWY